MSHDLRTPLAVIKGAVTNLLDESIAWDVSAQRDLLRTVNHESDRLNRLVGNLLDMSRIESGALQSMRSYAGYWRSGRRCGWPDAAAPGRSPS